MTHLCRSGVAIFVAATLIALVSTLGSAADTAYDQAKLQAYVAAWTSVDRLKGRLQQRIGQADGPAQKNALAREGEAEVKAMVAATPGITIAEYQEIARAAQNDPALMQRIRGIAK